MNWWFIIGVTVAGILCLIKVIVDRQGKKEREFAGSDYNEIKQVYSIWSIIYW